MPHATDTLTRPRGNDATHHRDTPELGPTEKAPGVLGLSLTQILGGALAAVSAAALGARLGLAGTLTGAAIGSVVSAVAAAAYTESLRHTRTVIRTRTLTAVAGARTVAVVGEAEAPDDRASRAETPLTDAPRVDTSPAESSPTATVARGYRPRPTRARDRALVRRVALGATALFAGVILLITGIELGLGRALDGQSGTTVHQVVEKAGSGKARGTGKPLTPTSSSTSDAPSTSDTPSDSPTSQTPVTTSTDTPTTSTDTPTTSTDTASAPTDQATSPVTPDPASTDATTPAAQGNPDPSPVTP